MGENMLKEKEYTISISKEELSRLPAARFDGRIMVVDTLAALEDALADLKSHKIIGFDTETKPCFKKGQSNQVSLVQLATPTTCYLIRINKTGLDHGLVDLLEDAGVRKVGLSIHDDFHNLRKLGDLEPEGFVELQTYVKSFHIVDNSLTRIYAVIFGQRISKGQRLTNWEADELTRAQQAYAALDAAACLHIHDQLSLGNFHPENSPYLHFPEEEPQDEQASILQ